METPTQEVFDNMKEVASGIWNTYDDTYGYVTKKLKRINELSNIEDNAMIFYRMFDWINQNKMISTISKDSLDYINRNN